MSYKPNIDYDTNIEAAVLGICLIEPHAFGNVYNLLIDECFYEEPHKVVYSHLKAVFDAGSPIDIFTVSYSISAKHEQLGYHSESNEPVPVFLTNLARSVFSSAHLEAWCMILREMAAKRAFIAMNHSDYSAGDVFENSAKVENTLKKIFDVKATDSWEHISQVAIKAEKRMSAKSIDVLPGITTTFAELDEKNGGFRPDYLYIIAARASVGKSAIMSCMATAQAQRGRKVGIISLEMGNEDIFDRMVSAQSDVFHKKIDRNDLSFTFDRDRVYNSITSLSQLPIYFSDKTKINIHDVRAKAEKLVRKFGCDILYIDYLQLMEAISEKGKTREQEVAQMSTGLKHLAMNLHIPVVALAQLSRDAVKSLGGNKKPQLHHLRESGSLEQNADGVIMLYRDWMEGNISDAMGNSTEHQAELLIRKWRNGSTFEMKIGFDGAKMRFYDIPENEKLTSFKIPPQSQAQIASKLPDMTGYQKPYKEDLF